MENNIKAVHNDVRLKEAESYECWKETPPFQPFVSRYADSYQEYQMSWNPYCIKKDALFYEFVTGDEEADIELISDACQNLLFEFDGSEPCVRLSGLFLHPQVLTLKANTVYFGFKPYSNLGFKSSKINLRDMVDSYTDFTQAYPCAKQFITDMAEAKSFSDRTCLFIKFAWDHLVDHSYSPTFVDYLTVILCSSHGHIVLHNLDRVIGYSERYCREKFKECHGISPKQYSDIIRFQNTLKALIFGWYKDLSSLAIESGYCDQSHLSHDFRRYTNLSPGKYLEKHIKWNI
jgi:AraC-like DNA-binding protein